LAHFRLVCIRFKIIEQGVYRHVKRDAYNRHCRKMGQNQIRAVGRQGESILSLKTTARWL
jgi:hypothetical protein